MTCPVHNTRQLIMQKPNKLVTNDPYKCHLCGQQLYVTIERAAGNDLLTNDIMWYLNVTEQPLPTAEKTLATAETGDEVTIGGVTGIVDKRGVDNIHHLTKEPKTNE